jgi:hypothetical protein
MGTKFGKVFARWVAFMLGKSILGIEAIDFQHDAVALDLGNNAGCRNAEADAVTADQRGLRAWKTRDGKAIDEGVGGAGRDLFDHGPHSGVRCAEDIEAIDFLWRDGDGCPTNLGIFCDLGIETLAGVGAEFLGVVEASENEVWRQDDSAYNNWTSEWSSACLINAYNRA